MLFVSLSIRLLAAVSWPLMHPGLVPVSVAVLIAVVVVMVRRMGWHIIPVIGIYATRLVIVTLRRAAVVGFGSVAAVAIVGVPLLIIAGVGAA